MIPPPPPGPPREIEIFTQQQLEILPLDAKTSIVALEANLPQKELLVLNPLVLKLLKVKELEKLEYTPLPEEPTEEEIQLHKESIEKFKEAKKEIAALKKQNGEAKSAIKKPLDLLGSQVLTIEKSINSVIVEVLESLSTTFKPYLDAESEKAAKAKAAKEAKATEAINKLTEENTAQANAYKKSTLITFLKYEMLGETKVEVQNAIENYIIDKLFLLRDSLPLKTFEVFTKEKTEDLSLLDEQELASIKEFFNKEINLLTSNLNVKITALQLEKTNEKLSDTVEQQTEQLESKPSLSIPPPPTIPAAPISGPPTTSGSPASNSDFFDVLTNHSSIPYGAGANNVSASIPIELYPKNSNEVDFLDLVIDQINNCKNNIAYIRKRFLNDTNIEKTEDDKKNIEKVRGADFLLDKTIDYILDKLPPAPSKQ